MTPLFWIQIVGDVVFCGAYAHRARIDVAGTSVVQLGLVAAFMAFNLALAPGARRASPGRSASQAVSIYVVWLLLSVAVIGAALSNPAWGWSARESAMLWTSAGSARRSSSPRPCAGGPSRIRACTAPSRSPARRSPRPPRLEDRGGRGLGPAGAHDPRGTRHQLQPRRPGREDDPGGGARPSRLWLAASEGANWLTWGLVTAAWLAA